MENCILRAAGPGAPLVLAFHGRWEDEKAMVRRVGDRGGGLSWAFPRAPLEDAYEFRGKQGLGYSWYEYNGDAEAFKESLRVVGHHVLERLDGILRETGADPRRVHLLGFSQGGYLAGALAFTWPERFAGAALMGARFKTELLEDGFDRIGHLRLYSGHGVRDRRVLPEPAARCVQELVDAGVAVEHREYDCGHRVVPAMIDDALAQLGLSG